MSCRSLLKVIVPATLLLCSVPAWAESRMALVIGQSAYKSVPALPNPGNDARAVTQLLTDSGKVPWISPVPLSDALTTPQQTEP